MSDMTDDYDPERDRPQVPFTSCGKIHDVTPSANPNPTTAPDFNTMKEAKFWAQHHWLDKAVVLVPPDIPRTAAIYCTRARLCKVMVKEIKWPTWHIVDRDWHVGDERAGEESVVLPNLTTWRVEVE